MKKRFLLSMPLLFLGMLLLTIQLQAQDNNQVALRDSALEIVNPHYKVPIALSVFIGTQSFGGDVKIGISKMLAIRAGAAFLPQQTGKNLITITDFKSDNTMLLESTNAHLFVDFKPFKSNDFRFVGGLAYFTTATASFEVQPTDDFKFGDIVYTPDDIGKLKAALSWQGVAPYVGMSLFRGFPKKVFNITLDLGTYYLKAPEAHFTGTGSLANNSQNDKPLTENVSDYRWLPVLQLCFNFKLK